MLNKVRQGQIFKQKKNIPYFVAGLLKFKGHFRMSLLPSPVYKWEWQYALNFGTIRENFAQDKPSWFMNLTNSKATKYTLTFVNQ